MKIVDFINFYNPNIINPYIILLPMFRSKKNWCERKFGSKNSARFYLNFPTGKLFGKLSFLQNFSGGAHSALKHRYITLQPKEIILELSGSKIL